MKFNISYKAMLFLLCVTTVACNKNGVQHEPDTDGKTPISLSIGGIDSSSPETKAVITDGSGKTMNNFDKNTKIFMIMKSERDMTTHDGYEYKGDRSSLLYTVCRGDVDANTNTIKFDGNNQHYWDDAHARSSQLDVWAYAQKGMGWTECSFAEPREGGMGINEYKKYTVNTTSYQSWREKDIYPTIRQWNASHYANGVQDETSVMCQDLLFSNNLTNSQSYVAKGGDNRLKFNFSSHQFPQSGSANMYFYHAMSKITIKIKKGEGFTASDPFKFPASKNIELNGFNTIGLFNIKDGQFEYIFTKDKEPWPDSPTNKEPDGHYTIPSIYNWENPASGDAYTLEAIVVPNIHAFMNSYGGKDDYSRFVENLGDVMMEFTIDGNTYKIKSGVLYDALKSLPEGNGTNQIHKYTDNSNYIPLEAGKNYVFTFTVGKTKIDNISAKVADWIDVQAEEVTPSNAYVNVSVKTDAGSSVTGSPTFALYRAAGALYNGAATVEGYNAYADYNWEKGYEQSTDLTWNSTDNVYTTGWYWPDNKTFYHFRSLSPAESAITGNDAKTYIEMADGPVIGGSPMKDYIWGAPFKKTSSTIVYSFESGYCNNGTKSNGQIYKAIGATTDNINLTQFHMGSKVFVDLESVTGDAAVNISNATVKLTSLAKNAKLYLGNGLVSDYSSYGNDTMTPDAHAASDPQPYDYSYGVLPQPLSRSESAKVGIEISTVDGNVYLIKDLSTIKVKNTSTYVSQWMPGNKYYYKFILSKTAIENITATIVDWNNVETEEEEIKIQ